MTFGNMDHPTCLVYIFCCIKISINNFLGNGTGRNLEPGNILKSREFSFLIVLYFQLGNKDAYDAYLDRGEEGLKDYIYSKMWDPEYRPLGKLPYYRHGQPNLDSHSSMRIQN